MKVITKVIFDPDICTSNGSNFTELQLSLLTMDLIDDCPVIRTVISVSVTVVFSKNFTGIYMPPWRANAMARQQ
ncbi:hypothetical protein Plhal304r1_c015g0054481 [Plasmopara halstedii]